MERSIRQSDKRRLLQQHAVEKTSPRTMYLSGNAHYAFSLRCMDAEIEELENMDGVALSLTKDFEYAWHSMLNLKYTPDSEREADTFCKPRENAA